ncbi:MAG: class I SAM-dependent methyltransferase, partial [Nodosilinea sp.]
MSGYDLHRVRRVNSTPAIKLQRIGLIKDHNLNVDILRYSDKKYLSDTFINKLASGEYQIVQRICSVCGGGEKHTIGLGDYGFVWSLCNDCGFVYLSSQLSHHSLNEFYDSGEYQSVCMGGLDDQNHFEMEKNVMSKIFINVFDSLDVPLSNTSIMEIGCGSGGILAALAERGCSVEGFDLDSKRIEFGKKMGVENLFVADALNPNVKFQRNLNWVIVSNVLEHLFHPNEFLTLL